MTHRSLPFALVLVAFAGCNCDEEVVIPPGTVVGRVCHPDTGDALPNAAVVLSGTTTRDNIADGEGKFTFDRVPPGHYEITATLGDVTRELEVDVVSLENAIVEDSACRGDPNPGDTGDLVGQVCNRHTGALVSNADVVIALASGDIMAGHTDDTGSFEIPNVPAGEHIATIRGEGFQRSFLVEITKGETTTLDLADDCESVELGEGGIVGSFCDPETDGNLVNADVSVKDASGAVVGQDITDLDGQFEVNGLAPGDGYLVTVTSATFSFTDTVSVVAGELTPVTDPSSCADRPAFGRVEGQICDEDAGGRFVGTVDLIQGVTTVDSVTSSADGRFSFNEVEPGTYSVRAHRDGYERVFPGIVVEAFRTTFIQESDCPDLEDICSEVENQPAVSADGRILLVVDRSGSMDQNLSGQALRKWDALRNALSAVIQPLTSTVEFGLMLYPSNADVCGEGGQVIGLAKNNANLISAQLDATSPNGGTPTAETLGVAKDILNPLRADGRPLAVLLATDGGPNCNTSLTNPSCRCTDLATQGNCNSLNCLDDTNAVNAVRSIKALNINTYVVGFTGVESFGDVLDAMAVNGGTALAGSPKYYEANDQAALQQALEEITNRVLTCRVATETDLFAADSITVSVGSQTLPRDSTRQNGWEATDSHTVELFGSACDLAIASSDNVRVQTCVSP